MVNRGGAEGVATELPNRVMRTEKKRRKGSFANEQTAMSEVPSASCWWERKRLQILNGTSPGAGSAARENHVGWVSHLNVEVRQRSHRNKMERGWRNQQTCVTQIYQGGGGVVFHWWGFGEGGGGAVGGREFGGVERGGVNTGGDLGSTVTGYAGN